MTSQDLSKFLHRPANVVVVRFYYRSLEVKFPKESILIIILEELYSCLEFHTCILSRESSRLDWTIYVTSFR